LAGLTCDTTNVPQKSGFARFALKHRVAVVFPDTSPRGIENFDGLTGDYEIGNSAGFYIDAKNPKWAKHFNMYTHVSQEIPAIVNNYFPVDSQRQSITGFSMGGFGALLLHMKNPGQFVSVSAFAPINNTLESHWGKKMVANYFNTAEEGKDWDPSQLVHSFQGERLPILIDQGSADKYLSEHLMTWVFVDECKKANYPVIYNVRDHYDHSFHFVETFLESHFEFHARFLNAGKAKI